MMKQKLKNIFSSKIKTKIYPKIELFFWKSPKGVPNFGDDLSWVVVTQMLAKYGCTLEDEVSEPRQLLAIGSILHFAQPNTVVWGSGINGKIPPNKHKFLEIDVRAVRGPLTAEFLSDRGVHVPEIYGDPALLIPELMEGRWKDVPKIYDTVFVPNLNDELQGNYSAPRGIKIVSPMQSWNRCIAEIRGAKQVIASSLHGLILAEAFGVPARYLRLSEEENIFKYRDYYMGTGRKDVSFATSFEEALEMGGAELPNIQLQKLREAFPIDLWGVDLGHQK